MLRSSPRFSLGPKAAVCRICSSQPLGLLLHGIFVVIGCKSSMGLGHLMEFWGEASYGYG